MRKQEIGGLFYPLLAACLIMAAVGIVGGAKNGKREVDRQGGLTQMLEKGITEASKPARSTAASRSTTPSFSLGDKMSGVSEDAAQILPDQPATVVGIGNLGEWPFVWLRLEARRKGDNRLLSFGAIGSAHYGYLVDDQVYVVCIGIANNGHTKKAVLAGPPNSRR